MSNQTSELTINQLTSQIDELVHLLQAFSDILDSEAEHIKKNQPEQLTDTTAIKSDMANQLSAATIALEASLKPLNLNISTLIQSDAFKTFPPSTQAKVTELISMIEACHDKNLANGMSIQILSNINQHALDLLSGKPQDVKLYGSSGEKTRAANKQSNLGKA
ncbi:MAG: flagellar protein FlgN [Thiomicrorhabdus sp.]|nr:flagellar protein FlgN [Thiomicrorhabdus sp.]